MKADQLVHFDGQRFGDLVNLPRILDQNKTSTINASGVATPIINAAKAIDLATVAIEVFDKTDVALNDLYVKLDSTVKAQKDRRIGYTQFFDELRSLFTAEEKTIDNLKEDVKSIRNNWQKEKIRREKVRQDELQKELDKKNEAIEIKRQFSDWAMETISHTLQANIAILSQTFYSKKLEEMDGLQESMEKYQASFSLIKPKSVSAIYLTEEEISAIEKEVLNNYNAQVLELYINKMHEERDRLIELIPSRKMELERIAADASLKEEADKRIAEEQAEAQRKLQEAADLQKEASEATAESAKLNTLFEVHSTASPVIKLAKGTSVKKAYKATTHGAHLALLLWWGKNILPTMTIEDLNLKISFARTAANKALNEQGEMVEATGLVIEDDVTTRGRKSKTA